MTLLNTRIMAFCRRLLQEVGRRPGSMKLLRGVSYFLAGPEWLVPDHLSRDEAVAYCDQLLTMITLSPQAAWRLREIKGTLITFSGYKKRQLRDTKQVVALRNSVGRKNCGVTA